MKNTSSSFAALKSALLGDLALVAVVYCSGENDEGFSEYEMDVFDQDGFDAYKLTEFAGKKWVKCQCCGHQLKYQCVVKQISTGGVYPIGRDCAAKIESLQSLTGIMENSSIALLERAQCSTRERKFRSQFPECVPALDWAQSGTHAIAKDLASKVRQWDLSEKQRNFLISLHHQALNPKPPVDADAPVGRVTVEGVVKSVKSESSMYGMVTKVLVELPTLARVWGNAPSKTSPVLGSLVRFTATFEVSHKDKAFGFWKRPADWKLVA